MKVKLCPNCEAKNDLMAYSCKECNYDLFDVDPVDEIQLKETASHETEKTNYDSEAVRAQEESLLTRKLLKQCPTCGSKYPFSKQKCPKDDTYLEMVRSTEPQLNIGTVKKSADRIVTITAEDSPFELKLCGLGKRIIGREGEGAEYLDNKMYVGREHAVIILQENGIFIEHISRSNPTLVNGRAIEKNKPFELHDGDTIALGACEGQTAVQYAAYFRIRIDS